MSTMNQSTYCHCKDYVTVLNQSTYIVGYSILKRIQRWIKKESKVASKNFTSFFSETILWHITFMFSAGVNWNLNTNLWILILKSRDFWLVTYSAPGILITFCFWKFGGATFESLWTQRWSVNWRKNWQTCKFWIIWNLNRY